MVKLLNTKETAAYLKVSPGTLKVWRSLRKGPPYIKLGRSVRYSDAALKKYLAENRVAAEAEATVQADDL